MGFFNDLGKKTTEATSKITKETKLKLKMNENKGKISDLYEEIGKKVYEKHIREENINIKEEDYLRHVLPCSIQLLVENATKHNAISTDKELIINIESNGTEISIENNIIPKLTKSPSTGLGQKYIRQQYLDLSGKEVQIECTDSIYKVVLPLL